MISRKSAKKANWHDKVYFGLHYDQHANKWDFELGKAVTHEMLREAWKKIKPDWVQCDCKGHEGYTSYPTKVGYPSPGIVQDPLRIHRDVTSELGIPLVMHYSGIRDDVALRHHPEWRRVNVDGKADLQCACPRSDYVTELVIPQFIELIDNYDVDGFWVDGDIWATKPCYCIRCISAFDSKYKLDISKPPCNSQDPGWDEWLAFQRKSYDEYVSKYVKAVHDRKPDCLVCSNWMYSMRHPDDVTVPVDFLSGDFSGVEGAPSEAKFLDSRGISWDLMAWMKTRNQPPCQPPYPYEAKTVPHLCQEAAEVIANGGAFNLYINPQRNGRLVDWQHQIATEVSQFVRDRKNLSKGSKSIPQTVVLHGSTYAYANNQPLYGLEDTPQTSRPHPVEGAMNSLLDSGFHVDIQNETDFVNKLTEYGLAVIPEQDQLSDKVAEALSSYVEGGGKLVLSGIQVSRHPILSSLAGVKSEGNLLGITEKDTPGGYDYYYNNHFLSVDGEVTNVFEPWQPVKLKEAQLWTPLLDGYDVTRNVLETAAITLNKIGHGSVAAIHGPIFDSYYLTRYQRIRRLLKQLFCEMWETPMVEIEAPTKVVITLRTFGNRILVHLVNRSVDPPISPYNILVEKVPPVGPVVVRLRLPKKPYKVSLQPSEETDFQWNWKEGILTAELARLEIHSALVVETE